MGKRISTLLAALILSISLTAVPSHAYFRGWYGVSRAEFQTAIKTKQLKLKKSKVGKTVLYYDSKLPKKRVRLVKKWIKKLPAKVQKSAKQVYFLRKSMYMKTGDRIELSDTYGYEIAELKQIFFYNIKDTDELQAVLYHEFGHAYDSAKKIFKNSNAKQWRHVVKTYLGGGDPQEWYADIFADFFCFFADPDYAYILKTLGWR